jgi:hypothetical protein
VEHVRRIVHRTLLGVKISSVSAVSTWCLHPYDEEKILESNNCHLSSRKKTLLFSRGLRGVKLKANSLDVALLTPNAGENTTF